MWFVVLSHSSDVGGQGMGVVCWVCFVDLPRLLLIQVGWFTETSVGGVGGNGCGLLFYQDTQVGGGMSACC